MESKQQENEPGKPEVPVIANSSSEKNNEVSVVKLAEAEEPYDPGETLDETVLAGLVKPTSKTPAAKPVSTKLIDASKFIAPEVKLEPRNKRLDRSRKKNEKNYELFLKSLQEMSFHDQTEVLLKKTNEMMEEIHMLSSSNKLYKNKTTVLEKEKDMLKAEQNKSFIAKSLLENICRELQKQNKQIKDETAAKIREEEEKRKEVTTKFQTTLNDVSKMMEQNSSENIKLRDDNIQISDRFKKLCEEFKDREEDVQRISKQLSLEKKLSEASFARCQLELEAERCEKEVWLKEKEELLKKLHSTTKDKLLLEINCKSMEEHLSKYSDKYQKFESTITKSNEIFESYKVELASMSNQVAKLETDCLVWKDRWVQTSQSVNRLISVNQNLEQDLKISDKRLDQLVSLCRFLQGERTRYLKQLKEHNIVAESATATEIPSESELVSDPTSRFLASITTPAKRTVEQTTSARSHPLTAKEKELQSLRDEIVKLQSEINKAVEKEVEEKLKSKKPEAENAKSKRRAKGKKGKKTGKPDEKPSKPETVSKKPVDVIDQTVPQVVNNTTVCNSPDAINEKKENSQKAQENVSINNSPDVPVEQGEKIDNTVAPTIESPPDIPSLVTSTSAENQETQTKNAETTITQTETKTDDSVQSSEMISVEDLKENDLKIIDPEATNGDVKCISPKIAENGVDNSTEMKVSQS